LKKTCPSGFLIHFASDLFDGQKDFFPLTRIWLLISSFQCNYFSQSLFDAPIIHFCMPWVILFFYISHVISGLCSVEEFPYVYSLPQQKINHLSSPYDSLYHLSPYVLIPQVSISQIPPVNYLHIYPFLCSGFPSEKVSHSGPHYQLKLWSSSSRPLFLSELIINARHDNQHFFHIPRIMLSLIFKKKSLCCHLMYTWNLLFVS
jgi:hypothetical protein